jgi:tetratricopeptide (TPR) repeat protein
LVVVGTAVYLVLSGWFDGLGSVDQATPTLAQAATTPTPFASPQTPLATPSVTSLAPTELNEQLDHAWDLALRSEFEDACRLYQELVERAPGDARVEVGWAWALILDRRSEQALEHAHRAVELDPLSAQTMAVLARAYIEAGDKERAVGMAEAAVQLNPGSALARAVLAEAYLLTGSLQSAVSEADLALAQDTGEAEVHRIRGWLYQAADNDALQAAAELQAAADIQPGLWLRHYELGLLLVEVGDYDAAIVALERALSLRPKAVAYAALGKAHYHSAAYDKARVNLLQALSAGARDADTYAWLAAVHAQQDRCQDATAYLDLALSQQPDHPLALSIQSICPGAEPTSTPAPTKPPPTSLPLSGWIAFPVWNADKMIYDTYAARADGSQRHLVAEEMHQPAFSSDGLWLALNGERENYMNLLIVKPDGSGLKEITGHIEDSLPCWSPDSQSLVFSSTRHPDRQSRVYIIDSVPFAGDRAQGRPLTSDLYEVLGQYPTWTENGRIVYAGCDFTATPSQCGLFLMPSGPGPQTPTQLTTDASDTAPAAHGSQIAFMSNRDGNWEIYLIKDDGSGLQRLTNDPANDGLPTWSADGKTLAFVSDQGGVWAVWAMNPDGSGHRKLFDIGGGGLSSDWQLERISWGP